MSKLIKGILIVLVVLLFLIWIPVSQYNSLVFKDESVKTAWSQVENQYQRRYDLIPNLVETVKWYATHEKETLQAVIEARAKATQTNINANDAWAFAEFQKSQWALSSALSRLMVVAEQYPQLKANENFRDLQVQLEWTENRISVERRNYSEIAKEYNVYVRSFPTSIIASWFWFKAAQLFAAEKWAEQAPKVKF